MARYRKLIVAAIGTVLIGITAFTGWEPPIGAEGAFDFILSALTAVGVYAVPNA